MPGVAMPAVRQSPEELSISLESLGGELVGLAREGPGKQIAPQLVGCVQKLRAVWSALRELALVFNANRLEKMLEQEEQLRQAMEVLNGTVDSLSRTSERTAASADSQMKELQELEAIGETDLLFGRLSSINGDMRDIAAEMKEQADRSAADLGATERIIAAVDSKLRETRQQAMIDTLTRLLSRPAFEKRLGELAAQAAGVIGAWCIAMADIDGLDALNARNGHTVGDALLVKVAEIIQSTCETLPGSIVGRCGGGEFGILLPRCSLREGRQLAEEIRGGVSLSKWECRLGQARTVVNVTVSVGIVEHRSGEAADSVGQRARACLQQAKRRGRNTVVAEG